MKNKQLILLGANNPQTLRLIEDINLMCKDIHYEVLGWVDNDISKKGKYFFDHLVLGTPEVLSNKIYENVFLVNNITTTALVRKETTAQLLKYNLPFETLIHPSVNTMQVNIGLGCIIHENVLLEADVSINDHVVIASSTTICHESSIGDYTFISSGTMVAGQVDIQNTVTIFLGAKIAPRLTISKNSTISMGSVVFDDVPRGVTVLGNPATVVCNAKIENKVEERTALSTLLQDHFPKLLTIAPNEYFVDHGLLSSFETFQLIMTLENAYGIKIADDEVDEENIGSVDNLQAFIEVKLKS